MFASVDLARRIERAECSLLVEMAEAARRHAGDADILVAHISGGVAVFSGADAPINKLAGLGFAEPLEENALEVVEREFERRQTSLVVELSSLAATPAAILLTRRGYALVGFEDVLGVRLDQASLGRLADGSSPPGEAISVAEASDAEAPAWIDAVITGFAHPDTVEGLVPHESFDRESMEQFFEMYRRARGLRRYLAYRDGNVAGGASLGLFDGVALLCGAATLPSHRRRGVQSALLRARLDAATQAGCDIAVMTTQPGSKSQENGIRQGFSHLYTRAVLRRERP